MTAASPAPVHPRLGARVACRLQRILRPASWLNYWQGRDENLWTDNPGGRPGVST